MSSLLSMRGTFRVGEATMRDQTEVVSEALVLSVTMPSRLQPKVIAPVGMLVGLRMPLR